MIDIAVYAQTTLQKKEADLIIKYFKKYKFDRLWKMRVFFEELPEKQDKIDWIKNDYVKHELLVIAPRFATALREADASFQGLMEEVYNNLNIVSDFSSEFEFKSGAHGGYCPKCGKRELFVPNQGESNFIICSRKKECQYSSSIYDYLIEYGKLTSKGALDKLADLAGVNLEEYAKSLEIHTSDSQSNTNYKKAKTALTSRISKKEKPLQKIDYMEFDAFKKYQEVDFNKMMSYYHMVEEEGNSKMSDRQKFMMVISYIYYYSLQTNQTGKALYYKSRGISITTTPILKSKIEQIVREVGYLDYKMDLPALISGLSNTFPLEDLVRFGVINDANHKSPYSFKYYSEEGFCIIPNFDLYSNMVTGLKLRNTKLASWQNSNMKEPELSFGRIATPLPYGLTRDAIMKRSLFRLQEGSVDSFSLPEGNNTCDVAIPGVDGVNKAVFGLFKGQDCELWYDQDDAGQIAAWGAIKFSLKNKVFEKDFIGNSIRSEFNKINDKSIVFKDNEDGTFSIEDILIPDNEANEIRVTMIETILTRRNFEFKKTIRKGKRQDLLEAGAKTVTIKNWNKDTLGSDINEVLQNGYINSILN